MSNQIQVPDVFVEAYKATLNALELDHHNPPNPYEANTPNWEDWQRGVEAAGKAWEKVLVRDWTRTPQEFPKYV